MGKKWRNNESIAVGICLVYMEDDMDQSVPP